MSLQKVEQLVGIAAIASSIICLLQAYLHHAVLPILWLQVYLGIGFVWLVLYVLKIYLAYRNQLLFFTKTLKWWNTLFYFGLVAFLIYLNVQRHGSFDNMRYAAAFSFFLLAFANIKNYVNLSDEEQIEISYQSNIIKWENIIKIEKTPNGYGIFSKTEEKYAILNEHFSDKQLISFQAVFDKLITNHDDYFELQHLID
jgi:hypothetical protein